MKLFINGAWVDTVSHVFQGGVWKPCLAWVFINGAWKQVEGAGMGTVDGLAFDIGADWSGDFNFLRDVGGIPKVNTYTINVKPGAVVRAPNASTPAFSFGNVNLEGKTIIVNIEGSIVGAGGEPGKPGDGSNRVYEELNGTNGQNGGDAILVDTKAAVVINNKATGKILAGGGGAGGQGGWSSDYYDSPTYWYSGKPSGRGADGDGKGRTLGSNGHSYYSNRTDVKFGPSGAGGEPGKPGDVPQGVYSVSGRYASAYRNRKQWDHGVPGEGGYSINGINRVTLNEEAGSEKVGSNREIPDGFEYIISDTRTNFNLWDHIGIPKEDTITLTITKTGVIKSNHHAIPALAIGNIYTGKTLIIKNYGKIIGKGGKGGQGGLATQLTGEAIPEGQPYWGTVTPGEDGQNGSDAIYGPYVKTPIQIWNYGVIGSGGGGGGGAGAAWAIARKYGTGSAYFAITDKRANGGDGKDGDDPTDTSRAHYSTGSYAFATTGESGYGGGAGRDGIDGEPGRGEGKGKYYLKNKEEAPGGRGGKAGYALNAQVELKEVGTLYGSLIKQNIQADLRITQDAQDVNLHALLGDFPEASKTIVIENDVSITSSDASIPAIRVGAPYIGKKLRIINNGNIYGKGGKGGNGGTKITPAMRGQDGGDCFVADTQADVTFENFGTLISGGGGGGGGSACQAYGKQYHSTTVPPLIYADGGKGSDGSDGDSLEIPGYGESGTITYHGGGASGTKAMAYGGQGGKGGPSASNGEPGRRSSNSSYNFGPSYAAVKDVYAYGGLSGCAVKGNLVFVPVTGEVKGRVVQATEDDAYDVVIDDSYFNGVDLDSLITDKSKATYKVLVKANTLITNYDSTKPAFLISAALNGKEITLENRGTIYGVGGLIPASAYYSTDPDVRNGKDGLNGGDVIVNESDTAVKIINKGRIASGGGSGGSGGSLYLKYADTSWEEGKNLYTYFLTGKGAPGLNGYTEETDVNLKGSTGFTRTFEETPRFRVVTGGGGDGGAAGEAGTDGYRTEFINYGAHPYTFLLKNKGGSSPGYYKGNSGTSLKPSAYFGANNPAQDVEYLYIKSRKQLILKSVDGLKWDNKDSLGITFYFVDGTSMSATVNWDTDHYVAEGQEALGEKVGSFYDTAMYVLVDGVELTPADAQPTELIIGEAGKGGKAGKAFVGPHVIVSNTGTLLPVPPSTYQWTVGGRYGQYSSTGGGPHDGYSKLVPSKGFGLDPEQPIGWWINADGKLHITTDGTKIPNVDSLKFSIGSSSVVATWSGTQYDAPSNGGFYNLIAGKKKKTVTVTIEAV